MVGNLALKSSPSRRVRGKLVKNFFIFLLARFARNPFIHGESHDFLTKQQHNNHQQEGHR
jgi:hypothetical protein